VAREPELRHPSLPFTVRVQTTIARRDARAVAPTSAPHNSAVRGVGQRLGFEGPPAGDPAGPRGRAGALVEILDGPASLGAGGFPTGWSRVAVWSMLRQEVGAAIRRCWRAADVPIQGPHLPARAPAGALLQAVFAPAPQVLARQVSGHRDPKNFSSRVRVLRPEAGEDREVLIYMNNPLRYAGETFYQASFAPDNDHA